MTKPTPAGRLSSYLEECVTFECHELNSNRYGECILMSNFRNKLLFPCGIFIQDSSIFVCFLAHMSR